MVNIHPGEALYLTLMDGVFMALKEVCYSKTCGLRGGIWQWDTLLFCGDSVAVLERTASYFVCQKRHPVSAMLVLLLREQ